MNDPRLSGSVNAGEATRMDVSDVIVAGGGPVGAMLALALRDRGITVVQLRGKEHGSERPIALSYGSAQLMQQLGVACAGTPIESIHISQAAGFGRTLLRAEDYGLPALGYVANYSEILAALSPAPEGEPARVTGWQAHADHIEVRIEADSGERSLRTRLLVIADGGAALAREILRDYGQSALVAEVETDRPHHNRAWERFTASGPIGLLPFGVRQALVWGTHKDTAESLLHLDEREFLARLQSAFGQRAGRFVHAGARSSFPLALRYRHHSAGPRTVLIGNAAQTLHPVAGQGLNLGLRDAHELAQLIIETAPEDLGGAQFLRRHARGRNLDRNAAIGVTDALVRVFSNSNAALRAARGAGLVLMDILPPARHFIARRMMFGARAIP